MTRAQEPEAPAPDPRATVWEGAIGLGGSYRPECGGATKQVFNLTPALFLRYGRFTITNASGFVTRRADDVVRGLGLDMVRSERVRVSVSLRFDRGRSESSSAALTGLGDLSGGWEQNIAPRTGYPVYEPRAGLRDASLFINLRHDIGEDWIALAGASATRLLGPAAASPLTANKSNWAVNAGLARRFQGRPGWPGG